MNKNYLIIGLIILALIVIGVIAAQPDEEGLPGDGTDIGEDNGDNGDTEEPSISVDDQEVSDNNEVVIAEVVAEEDGFIVIHATNEEGEVIAPASIGSAEVSAGTNEAVTVTLDEEVTEDTALIAMLHVDSNENGEYEFGEDNTEVDTPVDVNGQVVAVPFMVTVPTDEEEDTEADTETEVEADVEAGADTTGQ